MDIMNYTDFDDLSTFFLSGGGGGGGAGGGGVGGGGGGGGGGINGSSSYGDSEAGIVIPPAHEDVRTGALVIFLLTFIFGSFGNGLVIFIILRHPEIRVKSVANYYILNLAIADFFLLMTLLFFCYATFTGHWVFGGVVCKLAYAVRESNRYVSIFTLVALAYDRYLASFYNAGQFRTVTVGKLVCGAIWCVFIVMTTPYLLHCEVTVRNSLASCQVNTRTTSITALKAWIWTQFSLGFLLPFLLILSAYAALGARLHRLLGSGTKTGVKRPGRAMTRMTLVITVAFLLTQLPYNVVSLMNVYKRESLQASLDRFSAASSANRTGGVPVAVLTAFMNSHDMRLYSILYTATTALVFVCSCCNPIIYGLLNKNYRKLYAGVLCRRRRRPETVESGAGSSDGETRTHARHTGVTRMTGVTNTDVIEMSSMME